MTVLDFEKLPMLVSILFVNNLCVIVPTKMNLLHKQHFTWSNIIEYNSVGSERCVNQRFACFMVFLFYAF